MHYGLIAFGSALGTSTPVEEVANQYSPRASHILAYGHRNVLRCDAATGVTDLAVEAGLNALAAADVAPTEIDLVVLAITDLAEYLYWDPAASVAHRLGAKNAEAVFVNQACTGGVTVFDVVAGKFATHPSYGSALIIVANRCCEAYWNRMETQPTVYSDGSVAALARRDYPRLRWLATEIKTDGRYSDFFRLEVGGARTPFSPALQNATPMVTDSWSVLEFFDNDIKAIMAYSAQVDDGVRSILRTACARTGTSAADLSPVILMGDNMRAMTSLSERLEVPSCETNIELAREFGHLGAADHLFALMHFSEAGKLVSGKRIALVARGAGLHWACTLLEA